MFGGFAKRTAASISVSATVWNSEAMMERIGRAQPIDRVDEWIASTVRGLSFVDIGGIGEFATNERASWAHTQGAARAAMADFEPFDHRLWAHYRAGLAKAGLTGIETFERANIDDPNLPALIGQWDMVHSTGILYHVPNPVHSLLNLRRIVRRFLIVNTVIVPERIGNVAGSLVVPRSACLFFGALRGTERDVLREHYRAKFGHRLDDLAPERAEGAVMPYMREGAPSYYPYWWVFTAHSFEVLLGTLGMRMLDSFTWEDHAHFAFLELV